MSKGLGKKLWEAVETAQGRSFVSDDFCTMPDQEVIYFCLSQLPSARRVVREFQKIAKGYELVDEGDSGGAA